MRNHLELLKKDPFASAIKVENLLKSKTKVEKLKQENKKNSVFRLVDAGYSIKLRFINLNQEGTYCCFYTKNEVIAHEVTAIDHTNEILKQSIIKKLRNKNYFDISQNNLHGIIISKSLYNKIGYNNKDSIDQTSLLKKIPVISYFFKSKPTKNGKYELPDKIMFLTNHPKCDPFEHLNFCKETDNGKDIQPKHIMRYTISVPLLDIAENLPYDGDAIITKEYYNQLVNHMYCPCHKFNHFYIKGLSVKINKKIKKNIEINAEKEFEDYKSIDYIPTENMIKINLLFEIPKWQIEQKLQKLKKAIQINIESEYEDHSIIDNNQTQNYDYVYLFLNEDININNIDSIRDELYSKYGFYINEHQINTLKHLQGNLKNMNTFVLLAMIIIEIILGLYLIIFINMFLQHKIHKLGVLKSMGASNFTIFKIYIIEALTLVIIPLALSFILSGILVLCYDKSIFHLTFFNILSFSFITIISSCFGAFCGILIIVNQVPYRIISYRS